MGGGSSKVSASDSKLRAENEALKRKSYYQESHIRKLDAQISKLSGSTKRSNDVTKRIRKKRLAVSGESNNAVDVKKPEVIPKDPSTSQLLLDAVQESILFHVDANPT
jgi:hypothetical protein